MIEMSRPLEHRGGDVKDRRPVIAIIGRIRELGNPVFIRAVYATDSWTPRFPIAVIRPVDVIRM